MSLVSALVTGGLLGVHHALEADHLAAVAALVDHDAARPSAVGTSWGVGHSIPVVSLGLLFLGFGVRVPAAARGALEVGVGVLLVALGGRLLVRAADVRLERHLHSGRDRLAVGRAGSDGHSHAGDRSPHSHVDHSHVDHSHADDHSHVDHSHADDHSHVDHSHADDHGHSRARFHTHLRVGDDLLGLSHQHVDRGGFLVGVVHGVAGSGLLVVALVSTAETLDSALAFLGGFTALSVATMGSLALVWGSVVDGGRARVFEAVAGAAGVAVGALLVAEQVLPLL